MKLEIKTEELQGMVSRVAECVSNNKLIPLTSLMSIWVEDGSLILITTDATNYYFSKSKYDVDCEDFEVSVLADLFTNLVKRTTTENMILEVDGDVLKVTGNGTYTFELPMDENGLIKFPKKDKGDRENLGKFTLAKVKEVISANKASLATSMELPILTYYYCGNEVITSDKKNICENGIKLLDEPILISGTVMDLLSTVSSEDIYVKKGENDIIFNTDNEIIYTPITDTVNEFPVNQIKGLIDTEFTSSCLISRVEMLDLLDRLSLFVNSYDKKGIYVTVDESGLLFSSKKSSGKEIVKYENSKNFEPYACCVNIEMLKNQLMSLSSDKIEFYYGSEKAIKLKDKNIVLIIALIMDSEV